MIPRQHIFFGQKGELKREGKKRRKVEKMALLGPSPKLWVQGTLKPFWTLVAF
jgi:hypothetical protein